MLLTETETYPDDCLQRLVSQIVEILASDKEPQFAKYVAVRRFGFLPKLHAVFRLPCIESTGQIIVLELQVSNSKC